MSTPYEDKKREDEARKREAERLRREREARETALKTALRDALVKALKPHASELEADGFRVTSGDHFVRMLGFEARRGGVGEDGRDTAGAGLFGYPWVDFLDKPVFADIQIEMGNGKTEEAQYRHANFKSANTAAAVEHLIDVAVQEREKARGILREYAKTRATVAASNVFVTIVWGAAALLLFTLWVRWGLA